MRNPLVSPRIHCILVCALCFPMVCHAATPGKDSADQPAYQSDNHSPADDSDPKDNTNGWVSGDNGGSGFKGWNLVASDTTGGCGFFIGDSRNLAGASGADINQDGKSFGLFAKGKGRHAEAYRTCEPPLEIGQNLLVEIAVNFRNGQKGVDLRDPAGNVIFNLNIGADDYIVTKASSGNGSLGSSYHNKTSFKLTFTQTSASGGTWSVTRQGGVEASASGLYSGIASGMKFYVMDTDNGSENDLFVNNLAISAKP